MNQLHPDASLIPLLLRMVAGGVHIHLYTNVIPDDLTPILTDFVEETAAGYAAVNVAVADFTLQTVTAHVGQITAPDVSFVPSAATTFTNYGYYITDAANATLLAFAVFDAGPIVTTFPASLQITPKMGLQSKFAS